MLDHRIETFLTLCEEMNYRRTAERLNMTQPGVTQHIQYLERYYGVALFSYDGRTLTCTENARMLRRHLELVRAEEQALRAAFAADDTVRLRVGATKTIGEYVMVPAVRRFLADGRHSLDLVIDNTEMLLRMLEHGELDFAVIEGVFDKARYGCHLYRKERFVGLCAASHRFAGREVTLEELLQERLVVREQGSGTRRLLERALEDRGYSLERFRHCSAVGNFSVICELVARDGAVTFAYAPVAQSRRDIATFTVRDMQIAGEFNFVYCSAHAAREKIDLLFAETMA